MYILGKIKFIEEFPKKLDKGIMTPTWYDRVLMAMLFFGACFAAWGLKKYPPHDMIGEISIYQPTIFIQFAFVGFIPYLMMRLIKYLVWGNPVIENFFIDSEVTKKGISETPAYCNRLLRILLIIGLYGMTLRMIQSPPFGYCDSNFPYRWAFLEASLPGFYIYFAIRLAKLALWRE